MRILCNPDPATTGGAAGNSTPPPPPPPATIALPKDEVEALFTSKRELETLRASMAAQVKAAADASLVEAARDKAEAVAKIREEADRHTATLTTNWLKSEAERTVAGVLASARFRSAAAATQATKLLSDEIEAVLVDGKPLVRSRATGQPAAAVLAEKLASPDFAHFLEPTGQGGAAPPPAGGSTGSGAPADFAAKLKAFAANLNK